MIFSWFKQLLQPSPAQNPAPDNDQQLASETELQNLRIELGERDKTIANLKQQLERQRQGEQINLQQNLQSETEQLFSEIASPISQLLTQAHLHDNEGKPVQAKDILTVAKRLINILESKGLSTSETIGQIVPFDPNHHQPLNSQHEIITGAPVVIKIVGIAYRQKILKKALVELAE